MILAPPELPPDDPPPMVDMQPPAEVRAEETVADGNLTLHWAAPEACPEASEVLTAIDRYLAPEESKAVEPLDVRGEVDRAGDTWTLVLVLDRDEQRSRRQLEAGSCELLGKGAALVVAVHIDAVGTSARIRELETPVAPEVIETAPGEVEVSEALPESSVTVTPPPPPPPPVPIAVGGVLRTVLTGGVGNLPRFPHGFAIAGGVTLSTFRIELQVDYAVPRQAPHPDNGDIAGRFQSVAGTVRGCWAPVQGGFAFPLCLGVRGTGLQAEGRRGVRDRVSVWSPWGAVALEPAVVYSPIDRLGIFGSVGALVAFNRPGFAVGTESAPIFRVSAISAVVTLGVEVNLSARNRGPR